MIIVFITIGIRVSELKYLTIESVKKQEINFFSKGKQRKIFLPETLCKAILEYCTEYGITNSYIFGKKNGSKPYDKSTIWRKIKQLTIEAGVKEGKGFPHNLRHFFAISYLEKNNNNIAKLSEELGHSSIETTKIYLNYTREDRRMGLENVVICYSDSFKFLQNINKKYAKVSWKARLVITKNAR